MMEESKPRLIIFSGAGLDAESGVPTFRDANGLWEGHNVMQVCTIGTFADNYQNVHRFYNQRRQDLKYCEPNDAHKQIAEWEQKYGSDRVINITANVSDLLERAGVNNVMHIHGKIWEVIENYKSLNETIVDYGRKPYDFYKDLSINDENYTEVSINAKPNVVFFGQSAPLYEDMHDILSDMRQEDTLIIVGTTLEINPIHSYVIGSPCHSILVNPSIDQSVTSNLSDASTIVTEFVVKPATSGFASILDTIEKRMQ